MVILTNWDEYEYNRRCSRNSNNIRSANSSRKENGSCAISSAPRESERIQRDNNHGGTAIPPITTTTTTTAGLGDSNNHSNSIHSRLELLSHTAVLHTLLMEQQQQLLRPQEQEPVQGYQGPQGHGINQAEERQDGIPQEEKSKEKKSYEVEQCTSRCHSFSSNSTSDDNDPDYQMEDDDEEEEEEYEDLTTTRARTPPYAAATATVVSSSISTASSYPSSTSLSTCDSSATTKHVTMESNPPCSKTPPSLCGLTDEDDAPANGASFLPSLCHVHQPWMESMQEQLRQRDQRIAEQQETIERLQQQVRDLQQHQQASGLTPTHNNPINPTSVPARPLINVCKISQIPIEDMLQLMREYGSEVSDATSLRNVTALDPYDDKSTSKSKKQVQRASIVRQFRRWNPNFFRYFTYSTVDGWVPILGKAQELERRRLLRQQQQQQRSCRRQRKLQNQQQKKKK